MEKGERSSFILYHQFANFFALLSMEERGELITAIFDYDANGREPKDLAPVVQMAFVAIRDALDRDHAAYAAKCERNAANGRRGGRPRKDFFAPKTERFFEKPKKADYEFDLEHEHDLDLEHEHDLDREQEQELDLDLDRALEEEREAECLPIEGIDPDPPWRTPAPATPSRQKHKKPCRSVMRAFSRCPAIPSRRRRGFPRLTCSG